MIFQTENQINIFLIFLFLGIILEIFFSIIKIVFLIKFKKNFKKNILNCLFFSIFSLIFVVFLIFFNFGIFKISILIAYILGFCWSNFVCKNLVVFFENKWYNTIIKIKQTKKEEYANKSKQG